MRERPHDALSLFGRYGSRKYLNGAERRRFLESAQALPPPERLFCETLVWTGARVSEVLAVTPAAVDLDSEAVTLVTVKRRNPGTGRQVPLPKPMLLDLNRVFKLRIAQRNPQLAALRIWRFSRTTAWRCVKATMTDGGIAGLCAMPKGLRHSFGVNAFQSNVPPHLV